MKRVLITLLIVDLVILILLFLFAKEGIFLSFEVGFLSSSSVILASFESYKRVVLRQVTLSEGFNQPDTIDKIEDPYSLYDKDEIEQKSAKEILDEERKRLKESRNLKNSIKNSKSFFNPIKLSAYVALVFGFFYLNSNGYLNISAYLISLATPIVVAVWVLLGERDVIKT